jgi:glutaconate CoA-transferase subunit A
MTQILNPLSGKLLASLVTPGGIVGLGGTGLQRKPMGLIRTLSAATEGQVRVVSFLGSVDVEYLVAKNQVSELHTAGVSLDGAGLAPAYRTARQQGSVEVIEWSEGSLAASLEAAARGLPSMPCGTSPRSEIVNLNRNLMVSEDPFSGDQIVHARALQPDIAILHVSSMDSAGNLFIDGDPGVDGLLARSARIVIASAEETCERPPSEAAISRIWVDYATLLPGGSWPTATAACSLVDLAAVQGWAAARGGDTNLLEAR